MYAYHHEKQNLCEFLFVMSLMLLGKRVALSSFSLAKKTFSWVNILLVSCNHPNFCKYPQTLQRRSVIFPIASDLAGG